MSERGFERLNIQDFRECENIMRNRLALLLVLLAIVAVPYYSPPKAHAQTTFSFGVAGPQRLTPPQLYARAPFPARCAKGVCLTVSRSLSYPVGDPARQGWLPCPRDPDNH